MNWKISVFVICVETTIYLLLHNFHKCTFNGVTQSMTSGMACYLLKCKYVAYRSYGSPIGNQLVTCGLSSGYDL